MRTRVRSTTPGTSRSRRASSSARIPPSCIRRSPTAREASSTSPGRRIRAGPRSSRSSATQVSVSTRRSFGTTRRALSRAQILGYAGLDNKGLEGLERSLEGTLAGQPGSQTIVKDPFGRALDVVETKTETPGKDVRLTIDRQIQGNAEEVLAETVRRWSAKSATASRDGPADRGDSRHGDGAAVQREPLPDDASGPTAQQGGHRHLRARLHLQARHGCCRSAGGDREPAVFVPSAADPQGRRPHDPRVAHEGHAAHDRPSDRRVLLEHRDDHDRAAPRRGAARIVDRPLRLREEHGHRLPRRVVRVRAPARPVVGIHHRHRSDRPRHRGDARADGTRVLRDRERREARAAAPHRSDRRRRRLRRRAAAASSRGRSPSRCSRCCAASSSRARAPQAAIPGYTVAGKTGTAAKIEPNGRYSTSRYVASFVGLVPASKPELVIMVMVDEPRGGIYGGDIAAPAFREIARFNLQHLEIPQDAPKTAASNR